MVLLIQVRIFFFHKRVIYIYIFYEKIKEKWYIIPFTPILLIYFSVTFFFYERVIFFFFPEKCGILFSKNYVDGCATKNLIFNKIKRK